jgi:hypothetical protein
MIIIIQILVVIFALAIIIAILGGRQSYAARAWKKIALILLALVMVIAVLFPGLTNSAANIVGVGRGADLLLYLLTLAFIGYVLNSYLHQQKDKDILFRLARKTAILEANKRYNITKTRVTSKKNR